MLALAAGVVGLAVVGLARFIIPFVPDFSVGFEQAIASEDGSLVYEPTAVGGIIDITGDREGTVSLDEECSGPSFGLCGDGARMFFSANSLTLDQMSFDGLEFFPDPEDCVFTPGEHDPEDVLIPVHIECNLEDIRGNGTITLDGYAAMHRALALDLDLPDTGGTVSVGEDTWVIDHGPTMFIQPPTVVGSEGTSLALWTAGDFEFSMHFVGDDHGGSLELGSVVGVRGAAAEVPLGACSTTTRDLVEVDTQTTYVELEVSCPGVQVPGLGEVPIDGTVVFLRLQPPPESEE